jgi:hypothetical protein
MTATLRVLERGGHRRRDKSSTMSRAAGSSSPVDRRHRFTPSAEGRAHACLDPELVAGFVDGTISLNEQARVMAHVVVCHRCYERFKVALGL